MSSIIRHNWIEQSLLEFRAHFASCGYTVPDNVRVSVGFTKGGHAGKKALGVCYSPIASADGFYELFIFPEVGARGEELIDKASTINILETVAHELVHATVGNEHGHRGNFIVCAAAVGFVKPWRYTPAGDKIMQIIEQIIGKQGLFPAGAIKLPKKQGKSLVKCQCEGCDYVAYITAKQLEKHGTPVCPTDFEAMWCE